MQQSYDGIELEMYRQWVSLEEHYRAVEEELDQLIYNPTDLNVPIGFNAYSAESIIIDHLNQEVSMEGIGDKLKAFADSIAKGLGYTKKLLENIIATGYPLMASMIKRAKQLKENSLRADENIEEFNLPKTALALSIHNEPLKPEDLVLATEHLTEVTSTVLGPEKLKNFKEMSSRILEPYRGITKQKGKTDELVFVLGVVAGLTNPAVVVGELLKQLSVIVAPNAGKKIDALSTVVGLAYGGGIVSGMQAVVPTLGSHATSIVRDWSNGRMDISVLPNYQEELYPFCRKSINENKDSILITHRSEPLLGGRYFTVTDYVPRLTSSMRGSKGRVGADFKKEKSILKNETLTSLNKEEVSKICDNVIEMLSYSKRYAENFTAQTKTYISQYNQISDIVLSINNNEDLRGTYVRHSYRNAMNQVIGSLWHDCMGSDLEYIRYIMSTCKHLLRYCERSITLPPKKDGGYI